jgi:Sigma-70, region 4
MSGTVGWGKGSPRDREARDALVERYLPLARELARRFASTGEPLDDWRTSRREDAAPLVETLGTEDDSYARVDDRDTIARGWRLLTGGDRKVLELRFAQELSQGEIGKRVGYSQMHVSRLLRRGLGPAASVLVAAPLDDREGDLLAVPLSVEGLVVEELGDFVVEKHGGPSFFHDFVGCGRLRDERQVEGVRHTGTIGDADPCVLGEV